MSVHFSLNIKLIALVVTIIFLCAQCCNIPSAKTRRLRDKQCYASGKESISAAHKEYYHKNSEKCKESSRAAYANHPEQKKQASKIAYASEAEKKREA